MALGSALSNRFLLGDFEVRLANALVPALTDAHSVGVVEGFTLTFNPAQVDVLSGTSTLTQSYFVKQTVQIQFTFREFSWRNWQMAMGGFSWLPEGGVEVYVPSATKGSIYPNRVWIDGHTIFNNRTEYEGKPAILYNPYTRHQVSANVSDIVSTTSDRNDETTSNTGITLSVPRVNLGIANATGYYIYLNRSALPATGQEIDPASILTSLPSRILPFQRLQMIQRNRENADQYLVWDFDQVIVEGGMEFSVDNKEFSSSTVKLKSYGSFTYQIKSSV